MTKNRINRIRNTIGESRARLLANNKFYGILSMHLKYVATKDIRTFSTNGVCIYFNPDFLEKLHWYELDYIICHQITHIIRGHIFRPIEQKGFSYHHCCDIIVNRDLLGNGFARESYPHFGRILFEPLLICNQPVPFTVDNIYCSLPYNVSAFDKNSQRALMIDEDDWWSWNNENGSIGTLIIDTEKEIPLERQCQDADDEDGNQNLGLSGGKNSLKAFWKSQADIAKSMSSYNSLKDDGLNNPLEEAIKRKIEKLKNSEIDWKKVLNDFIQEEVSDYSFSPPDRRFDDSDFFLPDFNEREFVTKDILFMVDTSGSVSDSDLTRVYSEIKGAIEQFNNAFVGHLAFFDTQVYKPVPFATVEDVLKITPLGGGGTDFFSVFKFADNCKNLNISSIIIFTDGQAPMPENYMGFPVLWVLDNTEVTPPFGKVARVLKHISIGK